jgi:hypothetical protein
LSFSAAHLIGLDPPKLTKIPKRYIPIHPIDVIWFAIQRGRVFTRRFPLKGFTVKTSTVYTLVYAAFLVLAVQGTTRSAAAATPLPTTTSVTVDQQTGPQDTLFTFTASVTDANGPLKNGIVDFWDEDATAPNAHLSTMVLNKANGTATLKTNSFRVGAHTITVKFAGTGSDSPGSGSAPAISVTGQYASHTLLQVTSPGMVAQVAGEALGPLTGTVTFKDVTAGTTLATQELNTSVLRSYFFQQPNTSLPDYYLAVGDFNNDGHVDIITQTQSFLGRADGTFGTPISISFDLNENEFIYTSVTGDFNADGNLDLALLVEDSNNYRFFIKTFFGKGDGTFAPGPALIFPSSTYYDFFYSGRTSLKTGDFNDDGKLDLAFFSRANVYVTLGHGDGSFDTPETVFSQDPISAIPWSALTVGDFNGDGKADLAVTQSTYPTATLVIALGHGNASFGPEQQYETTIESNVIHTVDLNNDGKLDLVIGNSYNNSLDIFLGHGEGTFRRMANVQGVGQVFDIASGDFNGDGKADLMTSDANAGTTHLLLGHGDGTFAQTQQMTFDALNSNLWTADLNGDGNPDILVEAAGGPVLLNYPRSFAAANVDRSLFSGLGSHFVTATYSGDSNMPGSSSKPVQIPTP